IDHAPRGGADFEEDEWLPVEIARRDLPPPRQRMRRRRDQQQLLAEDGDGHEVRFLDRQRQQPRVDAAGTDLLNRTACGGDREPHVELWVHAPQMLEERWKYVQADGHAT